MTTPPKGRAVSAWPLLFKLAVVVAALGLAGAGILFPWGVGREPLFYKLAVVVAALGLAGAGILLLLGVVREPLFYKWAVVVAALGVYAAGILLLLGVVHEPLFYKWAVVVAALGLAGAGILLLLGVVREPLFFKWAVVVAALGVYAAGILLLWRVVHEPLFFKWAVVVAALGVYAAGILLLWRVVHEPLFFKWGAVVAALGVCAVGILLLWGVWDGTPVAAAFTRVGGATRVETALEASRLWLIPPQKVVETQTDSSKVMLEAAQCAMAWDAPLLFTSPDPKRQRRVDAMIKDWRKIETPKDLALPAVITITSKHKACHGMKSGDPVGVAGLSTLDVPNPLIQLPYLRPRQTLASVVVFAAAIEPGHLPDVAIGLALAAHMSKANREKVSLVIVPHYLESDPELENKLQSQHELVTGGVVLGQTPTVPEDTRSLLRQLLTSRDRHGVLGQLQDNLGSLGPLIAALLALVGLGTAAGIAAPIVIEWREGAEQKRTEQVERIEWLESTEPGTTPVPPQKERQRTVKKSDWLIDLDDNQEVTVCLRSGRQVTGAIVSQLPVNTREATAFRIKKMVPPPTTEPSPDTPPPRAEPSPDTPPLTTEPSPDASPPRAEPSPDASPPRAEPSPDASPPRAEEKYAYVLVSVKEIEQIHFNDPKSGGANANQTSP